MDTVTPLDIARGQLGTAEAGNGSTLYGRAYGMDRVAWCMQFVWWCFREAGQSELIHPKTAYTPTAADWHRQRGEWSTNPRVGSLVFYDWPDSVRRIQHVGLVEVVEPGAIVAIEGNTSTANQSDGGRVMRRRRARNGSIVGYGHPAYPAAPGGAAAPAAGRLAYGQRGPEVQRFQEWARRTFPSYATFPATGLYADQTRAFVQEFQRRSGITGPDADGRTVGPRTLTALARHGWRG